MKQLSVMLKPASSLCNMRCRYCFYADVSNMRDVRSYGIMQNDTANAIIANIYRDVEQGDSVSFAFQGGEPTLAGLAFFRAFAEEVKRQPIKAHVSWALQTNGTMLDEQWCAFLKENQFLVGISLDGDAALHNQNRLDDKGKGSFARVIAAKRLMDKYGVDYNVLCVLTNEAARHPGAIWKFILKENIRFIQFIPCLDDLDSEEKNAWALTPKRFYSFYTALFPLWQAQIMQGNYISVKLFDDIMNLFVRRQVTACGIHGRCHPQYIVESDGSVYPCDFYVLDSYRLGNLTELTLRELFAKAVESGFLESRMALPAACATCKFQSACNGGCKRMEHTVFADEKGFCGYKALLDERLDSLCQIAEMLLHPNGIARRNA